MGRAATRATAPGQQELRLTWGKTGFQHDSSGRDDRIRTCDHLTYSRSLTVRHIPGTAAQTLARFLLERPDPVALLSGCAVTFEPFTCKSRSDRERQCAHVVEPRRIARLPSVRSAW